MGAALLLLALVVAGCGSDPEQPEVAVVETVDLDAIPTVPPPTPSPTQTAASPTAPPDTTPVSLPELLVWPTSVPLEWPRTPDETALAFAQIVARGDRAAEPRAAVQNGTSAWAELPRLGEDGSPFGLATTIHMQAALLDDGSIAWVVASAQSDDIIVDFPATGDLLAGGTPVRGSGQGFEGTIIFQIEDRDGLLGIAAAQGGALGENLPFETHVLFDQRPASGDWAILTGFTDSAVDGSLSALTMLPMKLVDGS